MNTSPATALPHISLLNLRPLQRTFFDRPTLRVARDLLGCMLVHETPEGTTSGTIVEVEAYLGPRDRAAHTFGGRRTPRNASMWGPSGHAYVYFVYGMHFCMNIVTRAAGIPQAVLIRALAPESGIEIMRVRRDSPTTLPVERLANGPANLCRAMGINRRHDGYDLIASPLYILGGPRIRSREIIRTPRIGIDYAGEYVTKPWRLALCDHPCVSGALKRRCRR